MQQNCHQTPFATLPPLPYLVRNPGTNLKTYLNTMKKTLLTIVGLFALSGAVVQAQFTEGNLIVSRVGDGVSTLANTGGPISLLEFTTTGTLTSTVNISTSVLQWSGLATSEGAISLSEDGKYLTVTGYIPPFTGSGSLANRTDAQAPRGFVNVSYNGTVSGAVAIGAFSGNNIRSGVSSNNGTYFAGGTTGTVYRSTAGNATIQSSTPNTRVVNIINGNLYFSTGSGSPGVYRWTGTPTTATAQSAAIVGLTGQGTSPYDFAFNSLNTIAYIADSNIGVQKFTFDGVAWSHAYNITTSSNGLTGLAVDFSGPNPKIYAVNPSNLWYYEDTGTGSMTSIATAGSNYAFRGLEFAPVPEPATWILLTIGAMAVILRRKARTPRN